MNNQSETQPQDTELKIPHGLESFDFSDKQPSVAKYKAVYLRALSIFARQVEVSVNQLLGEAEKKSVANIKDSVHSLKGTCGSLGMYRIYELAKAIEAVISQDNSVPDTMIAELCHLLEVAAQDSRTIIALNESSGRQNSSRSYEEVCVDLFELLEHSEMIPAELIEEFQHITSNEKGAEFARQVVGLLEEFDYSTALKLLKD